MVEYGNLVVENWIIIIIAILIIWSTIWKGIALWKAARSKQRVWFIILLIVNTAGILEIIYLKKFQKKA